MRATRVLATLTAPDPGLRSCHPDVAEQSRCTRQPSPNHADLANSMPLPADPPGVVLCNVVHALFPASVVVRMYISGTPSAACMSPR